MVMMSRFATAPAKPHRIDAIGGIHCSECDHVISKLELKQGQRPIGTLKPGKCKECRYYNIVDLSQLLYS